MNGRYGNPEYKAIINTGKPDGTVFKMCEADFPLRPGWFYHAKEAGKTKSAAYLLNRYLFSVGNGGTMNIGVAPNRDGRLDDEDVAALRGFGVLRKAFFAQETTGTEKPFNVVVMKENLSRGEQVDAWELYADDANLFSGRSIGYKRIRILDKPRVARRVEVKVLRHGGEMRDVTVRTYFADPELVRLVQSATTESGETDTAKWMTGSSFSRDGFSNPGAIRTP